MTAKLAGCSGCRMCRYWHRPLGVGLGPEKKLQLSSGQLPNVPRSYFVCLHE